MKIKIDNIPENGLELDLRENWDRQKRGNGFNFIVSSPVRAHLHIISSGDDIIIRGDLDVKITLICARCLKSYDEEKHSSLNFVFQRGYEKISGERKLIKDELDVAYLKGEIIDTSDIICEQLLLDIPMKPLCSPACEGLCPSCGAEIVEGGCDCHKEKRIDPRFDVLKGLKII